jgi:subtilisin-like proprotein convertase family protein
MLSHMERVHEGLRGIVTSADTGQPIARAEIRLDSNTHPAYTDVEIGDYHRVVLPGTYDVHVSAPGYLDRTFESVVVVGGDATRLDVALEPVPGELQPVGSRVDDAGGNGILDPGETTDLAVTLTNSGREATGVQASLNPISWLVDVSRPLATYPDIPINEQAESNAPHHEVSVSSGTPAGHKAGFYLNWESAEGRGVTEAFYLDVGEPICETVSASDVPQMISALVSPHSELTTTSSEIQSLRVQMEILHTYIGDLQVVLTAPSGTTIILHQRTGGSADNIIGTYGDQPGDLTPAEPLSRVTGESAEGVWKLDVEDFELPNNGSLEGWSIEICGYPAEPTPELRFRDLAAKEGGVELRWWEYPGLWSYRIYRSTDPSTAAAFADVTSEDPVDTDGRFLDGSTDALVYYLVTGVGPQGEGPKGHFGE